MKLTFVTNYMNHHQLPMAESFFAMLGEDYHVIVCEEIAKERVEMGWKEPDKSYIVKYYETPDKATAILDASDVILYGGAEREDILAPYLSSGKLIFRYSERLYKQGQWKAISPRGLMAKYKTHVRHNKDNIRLLCAGGYVSSDFSLIHAYPGMHYRFGYFPPTYRYTEEELFAKKKDDCLYLMWAGRMIGWKQPERALWLAKRLKEEKVKFKLDFYGSGPLEVALRDAVASDDLTEEVTFHGFTAPEDVREAMLSSHILLFTSNREEGWGAVMNEAMNSGCVVVVDSMIGAAPYLIRQKVNGFVYPDKHPEEALSFLLAASQNPAMLHDLACRAYETITETWNAEVASKRLLALCESILRGEKEPEYEDGPLSKTPVIKPRNGKLVPTTKGLSGKWTKEAFSAPKNIYICHTFYHAYVTLLNEMKREPMNRGRNTIYLSDMSQNLTGILERLNDSPLVGRAEMLHEVRHTDLPKVEKYHKNRGNIVLNLLQRMIFTKVYARAQSFPLSDIRGNEVFVFCDSDPSGYVMNAMHIPYHAMEDGLNCCKVFDSAHVDNQGHFGLKKWMSNHNLIFIQNGYGKYCLDMIVNDDSYFLKDGPVYRVVKKADLEDRLTAEDKHELVRIFIEGAEEIEKQLSDDKDDVKTGMFLTENWPGDKPEVRKQVCLDIVEKYLKGYRLVIKPHPADTVDYKELLPEAIVLKGRFPAEIMNFIDGLHVDLAVSIITSAMDSLKFVDEKMNLGASFWDAYEDPALHDFGGKMKK